MYYIHYYHPPSVIHSDMVYDPEYMTGLYQREALSRPAKFHAVTPEDHIIGLSMGSLIEIDV